MRMYNTIKQKRWNIINRLKAQGHDDETVAQMTKMLIFESIFSVDYTQNEAFAAELSFTSLDWIIIMRVIDDRTYDFNNVSVSQRLQLCYNVFPGINGLWHLLAPNQKVCNYEILGEIFDLSAKEGKTVPIFRNAKGDTPVESCLDPTIETKNKRLAGLILNKIKDYPVLHSSHAMSKAVNLSIKERIP